MLCYSLFDDPNKDRLHSYKELLFSRENMMIKTLTSHARCVSHMYLDMHRNRVIPIGITTTHAFCLIRQNRRTVFACIPLWEKRDSAFAALRENRRPVSPWRLFDDFKLPPKLDVLATACFREMVCVLATGRLIVVYHTQGKWEVIADRELPGMGTVWTPMETVAICTQCVAFAYRNEEDNCCYLYAIPMNEIASNSNPIKARIDKSTVKVVLPEEIHDGNIVFGFVHDELGETQSFQVNVSERTLTIEESVDSPWPEPSPTDFMSISRSLLCHYSEARKQLVFCDSQKLFKKHLRPLSNEKVLSVEMFHNYAVVHYGNDDIELMNIYGEYKQRSRLLNASLRQFANISVEGLPDNQPVKPYRSLRTFSSSFFVMFHDGIVCEFQFFHPQKN